MREKNGFSTMQPVENSVETVENRAKSKFSEKIKRMFPVENFLH